ncbi:MAG TPA: phenylalanine--tRNA ligase subunit beta [Candidatus Acidoferrum sp.]|nr:phenylalanine--tRNA ligase subunit beta [Candidatus Acidoferrum sp.]
MKITLNWLKQYIEFNWSPDQLAERLTMLGLEVEGIKKLGGEFEGIVVAQVITREKHPNADKLSVCRVNDGKGERQIVCGADNFKAGDKVPLILPGQSLPAKPGQQPFTIKVGKIRGVESHGMMCSPQELGLPDQIGGLLILRDDAKVGQAFAEYLGRSGSDVVYDLEVTPNRPDLNSVIGIAREIAAVTGNAVKMPAVGGQKAESGGQGTGIEDLVAVRIEDPELCPRYTARVVRGVKIAPSPDWLRSTLEKVGIRSINNVVDVTNYVMLETGQPLHAFDYHLLKSGAAVPARPCIVVRRACAGEKFKTLDGQERILTGEMLLIADETKPVALAGVMGGQNTEINLNTVDVLVESAYFKPQNIRATSKKLELRTESSYRFERGANVGVCDYASRRAAQLILETAGGTLTGGVVDAYPKTIEPRQIILRHQKVNDLLGLQLRPEQIEGYLAQLELTVVGRKPRPVDAETTAAEPVQVRIPTFRVDLKREADLIEEVARLYGVDKIPATPPRGASGSNPYDAVHDELADARRILTGMGLHEAQGQTLISDTAARLAAGIPTGSGGVPAGETLTPLANPLSSDMNVLRPSLLPGLLDALRHNLSHKNYDVALFEAGRVFAVKPSVPGGPSGSASPVQEERHLALALTGQRDPVFWTGADRDAKFDIYDLKGVLEEFLDQFGLRGITYNRRSESTALLLESATIHLGKFQLGQLGQLLPPLAKRYDLRDPVLLAELNLDLLLARRNRVKSFKRIPALPPIRRDIAMLVPEATAHDAVLQVVKQAKPANLESVELFDVFRGKNVPPGQKSMAYAFTYRSGERTLTDAEVNGAHEKLVEQLKQKLQAVVRE